MLPHSALAEEHRPLRVHAGGEQGGGYVVDFLDFHWGDKHFANFNIADSCICIAAGLIFITAFQPEPAAEKPQAKDPDSPAPDPVDEEPRG